MDTTHTQFTRSALHFLHWNLERITVCLGELTEQEVWQRPNGNSNSVGNQLLHLSGNIRQWVHTGLGQLPDVRQRDSEFAATGGPTKLALLSDLIEVVNTAVTIIEQQDASSLQPERPVQAYVHDGNYIILHVIEHLSYHTGQIIFWTKLLRDKDLNLYGSDNLNQTN